MEFDDQDEDLAIPAPSYSDSPSPSRVKTPSPPQPELVAAPPPPPPNTMVLSHPAATRNSGKGRYRECLKNHAVGLGGHALDGCCEFMAAGADGTLDALKCAACNCHRNFHRKETITTMTGDPFFPVHTNRYQPPPQFAAYYRGPQAAGYLHVAAPQRGGVATLALPSTSGAQSVREELEEVSDPSGGGGSKEKRYRTKFTQEQKEKMLELAERLGWRIQKHDEGVVQEFCNETGVKRQVLKVWMHNNKHTLGKKP